MTPRPSGSVPVSARVAEFGARFCARIDYRTRPRGVAQPLPDKARARRDRPVVRRGSGAVNQFRGDAPCRASGRVCCRSRRCRRYGTPLCPTSIWAPMLSISARICAPNASRSGDVAASLGIVSRLAFVRRASRPYSSDRHARRYGTDADIGPADGRTDIYGPCRASHRTSHLCVRSRRRLDGSVPSPTCRRLSTSQPRAPTRRSFSAVLGKNERGRGAVGS